MAYFNHTNVRPHLAFHPLAALIDGALRGAMTVHTWQGRSRDRAQLRTIDDRLLRDIGLNRADVEMEINKPFWKR